MLIFNHNQRKAPRTAGATFNGRGAGAYTMDLTYGGAAGGTYTNCLRVRVPTTYNNATPIPLLVAGSVNKGSDGSTMMSDGLLTSLDSYDLPAIIAFIQWPNFGTYGGREAAHAAIPAAIAKVKLEWNINALRESYTGWSFAGFMGLEIPYVIPNEFAAIMVAEAFVAATSFGDSLGITPSPNTNRGSAALVATTAPLTKIRQFHNQDDGSVAEANALTVGQGYVDSGRSTQTLTNTTGLGSVTDHTYQVYPTGGHDFGKMIHGNGATFYTNWLLQQSR